MVGPDTFELELPLALALLPAITVSNVESCVLIRPIGLGLSVMSPLPRCIARRAIELNKPFVSSMPALNR